MEWCRSLVASELAGSEAALSHRTCEAARLVLRTYFPTLLHCVHDTRRGQGRVVCSECATVPLTLADIHTSADSN